MTARSRRAFSAALGASVSAGLLAPRVVRAAAGDSYSIVAAVGGTASPNQVISTSVDLYHRMTAPVRLNEQGPYFFVVDTGANQSVISLELAAMLGLPPGPSVELHGVADVETTPTVMVQKMEVGVRTDRNVLMPCLPQVDIGAAGIIGVDRLRNQRIRLDFHSRQLTVEASTGPDDVPPFTSLVPAKHRSGQLTIVDADLAGIPVSAFLDSGAEHTIGNPALLQLAVLRNPKAPFYDVPVISVTGKTIPGEVALLPELRLGSVRLVDITITFADLHVFEIWGLNKPSVLLGMDALSIFDSVTLDFGRAEVLFELQSGHRRS